MEVMDREIPVHQVEQGRTAGIEILEQRVAVEIYGVHIVLEPLHLFALIPM